jgi:hypothetical protein
MAAQSPVAASGSATAISARPATASKLWLRGAFLLAGAAQLITISALLSVDPLSTTWSALLLAIAPAPLAAAAAFTPRVVARPASVLAVAAMIVGIVGGIGHTGPLFTPAVLALIIGANRLWLADPW